MCMAACLTAAAFLGATYRLPFLGAAAALWAWRELEPGFCFARPFVCPWTMMDAEAADGRRGEVETNHNTGPNLCMTCAVSDKRRFKKPRVHIFKEDLALIATLKKLIFTEKTHSHSSLRVEDEHKSRYD